MRSMTGYGRARAQLEGKEITVELRAVNHRYFDCAVKVPRIYGFLEDPVKKTAGEIISRGKVDIFVTVNALGGDVTIKLNERTVQGYLDALQTLRENFHLTDDSSVMTVARLPEVFSLEKAEENVDVLTQQVLEVLQKALAEFDAMRQREGVKLAEDVRTRSKLILSLVEQVEKRSPERVVAYREKLEKRLQEILEDRSVDPQRILTEAAIFADKTAVDEETVRLRSHLSQLEHMLEEKTSVGRKLDFLVQEMNREANTIGSKANDVELSQLVVELKAEIEKIREQVQNIE